MNKKINRRIVLASRPHGAPKDDNFRLEEVEIPELKKGEVLLKTKFLSLDPYMRGRMSNAPSYAEPVKIDEVMVGGTVSVVEESQNSDFNKGEWVLAFSGWQEYFISDGKELNKLFQVLKDRKTDKLLIKNRINNENFRITRKYQADMAGT